MRVHQWKDEDYSGLRWFFHLYGDPVSVEKHGTVHEIERDLLSGHVEANTNRHAFCHAEVKVLGEDDVLLSVAVPRVFAAWLGLSFHGWSPFRWESRNPVRYLFVRGCPEHVGGSGLREGFLGWGEREFGVSVRNGRLTVSLGTDPHGGMGNRLYYRRRFPWEWFRDVRRTGMLKRPYYHRYIRDGDRVDPSSIRGRFLKWLGCLPEVGWEVRVPVDPRNLLGRYTRLDVRDVTAERWGHDSGFREGSECCGPYLEVVVPLPEGDYPARVTLERSVWGRPRWRPGHRVEYHTEVEIQDGGIPYPWKGTQSYNCGDDGLRSIHAPGSDPQMAALHAASSVMENRVQYGGGLSYVPDGGWPENLRYRDVQTP